mgnify:CR=1 FL=1
MAIQKYICRCGNRTDKLTSYFINGIRITLCDECSSEFEKNNAEAVDYDEVKKDQSKQVIDIREK